MLHIAFCDDDTAFLQRLKGLWLEYAAATHTEAALSVFTDVEQFLASDLEIYDIVTLDVRIGMANGMDAAQTFRQRNRDAVLVFISAYVEYAPQGYNFRAHRYLLKDSVDQTFPMCLHDAAKLLAIKPKLFHYHTTEGLDAVCRYSEILYCESLLHNVVLHLDTQPPAAHTLHTTLGDVERKLNDADFIRIQRSYLVNMRNVTGVRGLEITLANGQVLTCNRQKAKAILQRYLAIQGDLL